MIFDGIVSFVSPATTQLLVITIPILVDDNTLFLEHTVVVVFVCVVLHIYIYIPIFNLICC